jgi:hypothetical protein
MTVGSPVAMRGAAMLACVDGAAASAAAARDALPAAAAEETEAGRLFAALRTDDAAVGGRESPYSSGRLYDTAPVPLLK